MASGNSGQVVATVTPNNVLVSLGSDMFVTSSDRNGFLIATGQMFIINPLAGRGADNLFSTHPATGNRVAALMQLAGRGPRREAPPIVSGGGRRGATAVPVTSPRRGPWNS